MTAILIIFFVIFAFITSRSRLWGVFIILATLPSYLIRFSLGPVPTTALEVMILGLFAVAAIRDRAELQEVFRRLHRGDLRRWHAPIALFFLAAVVSVFVSPDTRAALGVFKAYFVDPLLFLWVFVAVVKTKQDRERALWGLRILALYVGGITILQWAANAGIPPPWHLERRATSIFPFPNAVGLLLAPLATLFRAGFIRADERTKSWRIRIRGNMLWIGQWRIPLIEQMIAVTAILAMLASETEAGIIAVFAGMCYYGIFKNKKTRVVVLGLLVFLVGLFVILRVTSYKLPALLAGRQVTDKLLLRDWSGAVRRMTWEETSRMLRNRPILGAGLSGYPITFAPYHRAKIEIFQYPHNFILNFWSEMGLLGLIAFLWIVRQFFRASPLALDAVMVTVLVHGLVDVPYFKNDLALLFWVLVGLAMIRDLDKSRKTA